MPDNSNPSEPTNEPTNPSSILEEAREAARKDHGYDWVATRSTIEDKFQELFDGKRPYSWQMDVTEALILGRDCITIAGTGSGKTLPFGMPLLSPAIRDKIVLVLSPLNELEAEQAERFKKMGLTATAVNGDVYSVDLHKEIESRHYQVLFTSPEMCLRHPKFSQLLRSSEFAKYLLSIIVDEAHCISEWGESFRKDYADLGKLRSYVPTHIPFLVTSATMPPNVLLTVQNLLEFETSKTLIINLGNDRPNITPIVARMAGAASNLAVLDLVLDEPRSDKPFLRTIIFFNSRDLAYKGCRHLQKLAPPNVSGKIDFIHALRSRRAKRKVMKGFRAGEVDILCATEAAGMGMDIPDIRRVIGFMVPSSLSVWIQRAGRAGRDKDPAEAILFVEPSVYQVRKGKGKNDKPNPAEEEEELTDDEDQDPDAEMPTESTNTRRVKKVEPGMREWIETCPSDCRRCISDKYFNNPKRTSPLTVPCCDICVLRKARDNPLELTPNEISILNICRRLEIVTPPIPECDIDATVINGDEDNDANEILDVGDASDGVTLLGKRKQPPRPGCRDKERLQMCRQVLTSWRAKVWRDEYSDCIWGPETLMSDAILTKLAKRARLQTLADIQNEIPEWIWADEYGEAILKLLGPIDREWHDEKERMKQEEKAKKARESAERKKINYQQRLARKREETAQRKATRAAEKAQKAFAEGDWVNVPVYPTPQNGYVEYPHPAMNAHAVLHAAQTLPLYAQYSLPRYSYPFPQPSHLDFAPNIIHSVPYQYQHYYMQTDNTVPN